MPGAPLDLLPHAPLREPVLMLAYAGWNDGGAAASNAVTFLLQSLHVERLGAIRTEEFLDYTVVRPHITGGAAGQRRIAWPDHEFFAVRSEGQPFDLVLGLGVEPHLRWRAYCRTALELLNEIGVRRVVLLGAYLDDVIYSQPVQVSGWATRADLQQQLGRATASYEGPTGIVGVLGQAFEEAGLEVASLWAALPHYISSSPNWRGSLALLQRFAELFDYGLDLLQVIGEAGAFDEEVSSLISADPKLSAYVRELKRRAFSQ
jgi:predicted ATP-grasp superfamily ATP-dependent carboligase